MSGYDRSLRCLAITMSVCLVMVAACGEEFVPNNAPNRPATDMKEMGTGDDTMDMGDMPAIDPENNDPPEPLLFNGVPAVITEGETIEFSTTVRDNQGFDDIVSGELRASDGASFGAFVQDDRQSWSLEVSWSDIQREVGINFETEQTMEFVAAFVDRAGEEGRATTMITLECDMDVGACAGTCGQLTCDGMCIQPTRLQMDENNCGACGNVCATGATCVDGMCSCAAGGEVCDGACVDQQTDERHCGACGRVCRDGESCVDGVCECPGRVCGDVCVDTISDPMNCGGCGVVCGAFGECSNGTCIQSAAPFDPCTTDDECTLAPDGFCGNSAFGPDRCIYPCMEDADCVEGSACFNSSGPSDSCFVPCDTTSDCPPGGRCSATIPTPTGPQDLCSPP